MRSSRSLLATAARRGAALVALSVATAQSAHALYYDPAAAFSTSSNQVGDLWSYGYSTTLGGPVTLFTTVNSSGTVDYWGGTPGVFFNHDPSNWANLATWHLAPQQLGLHPGPSGEYAVLRFTAPSAGSYMIDAVFAGADNGSGDMNYQPSGYPYTTTDVHVLFGSTTWGGGVSGYQATSTFNSGTVALAQGQTVDFAVGFGGNGYVFDMTALDVRINDVTVTPPSTATPEPATLALVGGGLLLVGAAARRRRTA
jgi:hypothetical protein